MRVCHINDEHVNSIQSGWESIIDGSTPFQETRRLEGKWIPIYCMLYPHNSNIKSKLAHHILGRKISDYVSLKAINSMRNHTYVTPYLYISKIYVIYNLIHFICNLGFQFHKSTIYLFIFLDKTPLYISLLIKSNKVLFSQVAFSIEFRDRSHEVCFIA